MATTTKSSIFAGVRAGLAAVTTALALAFAPGASGQTTIYEGFDYTAGELLAIQGGGTNLTDLWFRAAGGHLLVEAGSLSVPDLATSGNKTAVTTSGGNFGNRRLYDTSAFTSLVDGGEFWISFLFELGPNANINVNPFASSGGINQVLRIQLRERDGLVFTHFASGDRLESRAFDAGETVLYVARVTVTGPASDGANDTYEVWLNPTPGVSSPDTARVIDSTFSFQQLSYAGVTIITEAGGSGYHAIDEYRVGPTFASVTPFAAVDTDGDGIPDEEDVCPGGDDNIDTDLDGAPDFCDPCPLDFSDDSDGDGVCDTDDVCPGGDDTADFDGDGVPDECDPCPCDAPNDDTDGDGVCNSFDRCEGGDDSVDTDADGVPDFCDTCPVDANDDSDGDGVCDSDDICPGGDDNADADADGTPDFCDPCPLDQFNDADGDGVCGDLDVCPGGDDTVDTDADGTPDFCDPCPFDVSNDSDGDGVCDSDDICPGGDDGIDADGDGRPDFCDACPLDAENDADGDGICGDVDNCPLVANADQADGDGDMTGDVCDACPNDPLNDLDDDGLCADVDNCPSEFNPDQADYDGDGLGDACDPNEPPAAECVVLQLTSIGDRAEVSLSGAGSSDEEDDFVGNALAYDWAIDDGVSVLHVSGADITQLLEYGDYTVTLTVTDFQGASDSEVCAVSVNPASLSVFDCEKLEVKFCLGDADSDSHDDDSSADDHSSGCTSDRVKIKGEIGLPMGVDYAELDPMALVMIDAGGTDFGTAMLEFEVRGGDGDHWKYRADTGITKLDIDWKVARFKYKESGVPIEFESELITSSETVLTMEYKMNDIEDAFTVDIDGTELSVDEEGVVTGGVPIDVKKTGKKVTVTLPFPLVDGSSVTFGGALAGTVLVSDHYTSSLGRFKLEAEPGASLPDGAETSPRTAGVWIGVGGPLYPGSCDVGPDDLKVHSRKWKAKN